MLESEKKLNHLDHKSAPEVNRVYSGLRPSLHHGNQLSNFCVTLLTIRLTNKWTQAKKNKKKTCGLTNNT